MTTLSGGQAARASLASLLLSRYDLFLLDEPTNDLDLDGLERLERFVARVARRHRARQPRSRVPRAHRHARRRARPGAAPDQRLRRRLRGLPRRARAEAAACARGLRGVRGHAHVARGARPHAAELDGEGRPQRPPQGDGQRQDRPQVSRASRARSRRRRPGRRTGASSGSRSSRRRGGSGSCAWRSRPRRAPAATWRGWSAPSRSAGRSRSGPVSLLVEWADRIAITGANGSGKSTLLGVHARADPARQRARAARAGRRRRRDRPGAGALPRRAAACSTRSSPRCPELLPADIRTLLAKFGLVADHVIRPAATLSPGERTRAGLALLQARGRQPAGARRADEPPRPACDRAARGCARDLRGDAAAGDARPAHARGGGDEPAPRRRRRARSANAEPCRAGHACTTDLAVALLRL